MSEKVYCVHCGHVNSKELMGADGSCARCTIPVLKTKPSSVSKTLAYTLTAFVLCFPAYLFPFMEIEMYGRTSEPTIWAGVLSLIESRDYFVGGVVFLASLVLPILKILMLLGLVFATHFPGRRIFNTKLYQTLEHIGRWSMVDVFLLAILVSALKLGGLATVKPGIGATMFTLMVIFTMLGSGSFDSKLLWQPIERDNL